MASRSHGRCKVCRAIIHGSHRFGMCKLHSDQHNARIAAERKATKQRQAERRRSNELALLVLEEDPPMTEQAPPPDKPGRRVKHLTDEQEVEVLDAYTQTDESVDSISKRFNVRGTYVYNVLNRVGVSWRRGNPESYETWQARQAAPKPAEETVPEAVEKALENMLRLPVLPPKPEPVAPTPSVERRARVVTEIERWAITVQGLLLIEAGDLEDAIAQVRRDHPGLRIMKVELSQ